MKRRVADGIKRRRQTGELRPEGLRTITTVPRGPHFTKAQRATLVQAANLAIYALAEHATPGNREDYCAACDVINHLRREAGFDTTFMHHLLKGVAAEASELAGESPDVLDQLARGWLSAHYKPSTRVISIPT